MAEWDVTELRQTIGELQALRDGLLGLEESSAGLLAKVGAPYLASARNLLHYIALRRHDLRNLQDKLASLGLSSLGRAEGCVLSTIDAVLDILQRLSDDSASVARRPRSVLGWDAGRSLLESHTEALLGSKPAHRGVRIMVTMPGEAAEEYALVRDLLAAGMDCMRINCAHDNAGVWGRIISHLQRAREELHRPCRVLMDLPGPKLRTGSLEPGPQVLKWKPQRDSSGRVQAPARIWLTADDDRQPPPTPADACLPVPGDWLARLAPGDRVVFRDARGAIRFLTLTEAGGGGWWTECRRTAYVSTGTVLCTRRPGPKRQAGEEEQARVGELPPLVMPIVLKPGDTLVLTRDPAPGRPAERDALGQAVRPAHISCTMPEVFADLKPGERVWLDDGKIGGILQRIEPDRVEVQITQATPKGTKLGADKGINFPDSNLRLPALTSQDLLDLEFVAAHADLVGLSFVHSAEDVADLQKHLKRLGGERLGIVLKIETRRGFEQLPHVLLAALRSPCVGVMIARGDLAVECGYERLAELQEEILWICEAAHVPVIWATQVLEHLAKDGMPSRAEITDAAMGERAECVMLNKGPHIRQAVQVLDDILRRMQGHQRKKRSMLRPLKLAARFHETAVRC
jgi:pyruvate kinase